MYGHFAVMIVVAVFPEIHALPGAEGESALGDRDGEVHGGEGGAHMGGHIVGTLISMREIRHRRMR